MGRIRISIRSDGLAAEATAEPGAPCTERDLAAALATAGVIAGIDSVARDAFVTLIAGPAAAPATVVARGRAAIAGEDGRVEPRFALTKSVGRQHPDGRIDWHERDLLHPVADGALLATIVPPTAGVPGEDVRGLALAAKPGRPHTMRFGAGAVVEGLEVKAARAGVVLQDSRQIDVVTLYEHRGDVDLRSGNLHSEGSLTVSGEATDGSRIDATGDVVVGGSVQHAVVVAGGSVHVAGGILAGSEVRANAQVTCRHATSSRLDAGGDVELRDEATHSELRGDNVRIVSGRGTAFGGSVRVRHTIELTNAGTANGAATLLVVADVLEESTALVRATNVDTKVERSAVRARRDLAGSAGKMNRAAVKGSDQAQQQRLALLQRQRTLLKDAAIHVHGTTHAGVRIQFGAVTLPIERSRTSVRFRWDAEHDCIVEETIP